MASCNAIAIDWVIYEMSGNIALVPKLIMIDTPATIIKIIISNKDLLKRSNTINIKGMITMVIRVVS